MAVGSFEFFSDCLKRNASFRIVLPNEGDGEAAPLKLLVLLHGYCGCSGDWLWSSQAAELAQKYGLCIVLPSGENSFYLDGRATGRKYGTYTGQELIRYVRKTFGLSCRREDTFIGGFSMGGFGAIHTALQFPDTFGGVMALSSALIVYGLGNMKPGDDNGIANYEYYELMFGDPASAPDRDVNPEKLILGIQDRNGSMPRFYMACGEQDFLLERNRRFAEFLKARQVEHSYTEGPGNHDFGYWNRHLEPGIRWLLGI